MSRATATTAAAISLIAALMTTRAEAQSASGPDAEIALLKQQGMQAGTITLFYTLLGVAVVCLIIGLALSPEPDLSRPFLLAAFVAFLLAIGLGVFAVLPPRGR